MAQITCPGCKFFYYHGFDGDINSINHMVAMMRLHQTNCAINLVITMRCILCDVWCTEEPQKFFMDHSHMPLIEKILYIYGSESSSSDDDDLNFDNPPPII